MKTRSAEYTIYMKFLNLKQNFEDNRQEWRKISFYLILVWIFSAKYLKPVCRQTENTKRCSVRKRSRRFQACNFLAAPQIL